MSISRKTKSEALHMHCCSPELILSFLEQRCNQEDGERALVHLANCPECRAKAAFVCQAMAAEKENVFPYLTKEERQDAVPYQHKREKTCCGTGNSIPFQCDSGYPIIAPLSVQVQQ